MVALGPLQRIRRLINSQALERGDHRRAVATYIAAHEIRHWRSRPRLIAVLEAHLQSGPPLTRVIGSAALWREAFGDSGTHDLVAAALIAAIDQPDGPVPELPSAEYEPVPASTRLDWYSVDIYTALGDRALARQAQRLGIPAAALGLLMFDEEGIKLGPAELPSRWKTEALALDAVEGGWGTLENGAKL